MRLHNCTPHPVTFRDPGTGREITLPAAPAECVPRVPLRIEPIDTLYAEGGVALPVRASLPDGFVRPLPLPKPGTLFVVSRAVAEACPDRPDFVYPDDSVRDREGRIVAARALGTAARLGNGWRATLRRFWRREEGEE